MRIVVPLLLLLAILAGYCGVGVAADLAALTAGAEQGDRTSQWELGVCHLEGRGVPRDYGKAEYWLRKAAEQGSVGAQYRLGRLYDKGLGVTPDHPGAVAWYRRAAEQGMAAAQNNLGNMYRDGRGIGQDHAEAVAWYRRAVEQGDAAAQANLGLMYERGQGVTRDHEQAVYWLQKAAGQGNAKARLALRQDTQESAGTAAAKPRSRPGKQAAVRRAPVTSAPQRRLAYQSVMPSSAPRFAGAGPTTGPLAVAAAVPVSPEPLHTAVPPEPLHTAVPVPPEPLHTAGVTPVPASTSSVSASPPAPEPPTLPAEPASFPVPPSPVPPAPSPVAPPSSVPAESRDGFSPGAERETPVLHFRMLSTGEEPGVVRGGAVEQDLLQPAYQSTPAAQPVSRFVDNGNGTITDHFRRLVGLKNANCFGRRMWVEAREAVRDLASGTCQLTDGSRSGEWRLLGRDDMHILLDWQESGLFTGVVQTGYYWSSTPHEANPGHVWYLMPSRGMLYNGSQERKNALWPVRDLGARP
ncbi:MAG: hypothetical protein H7838_09085 [Magnetococcus sp. DMHC-8]